MYSTGADGLTEQLPPLFVCEPLRVGGRSTSVVQQQHNIQL